MEGSSVLEPSTNTTKRNAHLINSEKIIALTQGRSAEKQTTLKPDNLSDSAGDLTHSDSVIIEMGSAKPANSTSMIDLTLDGNHEHGHDGTCPIKHTACVTRETDSVKRQKVVGTNPVIDLISDRGVAQTDGGVTGPSRSVAPSGKVVNNSKLTEHDGVDNSSVMDLTFEGPKEKIDNITDDITKDVTNDVTVGVNDEVTNDVTEFISADKAATWIMENIDENISSITLDDFSTDNGLVNHSTTFTMSADSVAASTRPDEPGNRTISPTDPDKHANEKTSSTNIKDSACIVIEPTSTAPTNYTKPTKSVGGFTISMRPAKSGSPAANSTVVHKHKSVVNNRPPRVASRSGHPARQRIQSVGDRILEKYGYKRRSSAVLTPSASVYFFKPPAVYPPKILNKYGDRRKSLSSAKSSASSVKRLVNPRKSVGSAINSINNNMPRARVVGSVNPVIPVVSVKPFTPTTNATRIINPTNVAQLINPFNAAQLINPSLPGFTVTNSTDSLMSKKNALVSANPTGYAPILPKPTVNTVNVKMTHTIINDQGRSIVITTGTGPDGPLEPVFSSLAKLNSPNPAGSRKIQIRPQSKPASNTVGNATSVQVQSSVILVKDLTSLTPVQVGSNTNVGPQSNSSLLPANPAGQIAVPVRIVNTRSFPAGNVLNSNMLGPQGNSLTTGNITPTNQVAMPVTIVNNARSLPAVTMQSSINRPVIGNVVTTNQVTGPVKVIGNIYPVAPIQAAEPVKVIGDINPVKPVQVVNSANTGNWLQIPLITSNVPTPVNIAQATDQPNPVPMATNNVSTPVNIVPATTLPNPVPVVANPTVLPVNSGSGNQVAVPMQAVSNTCRPTGTVNANGANQGAVQLVGSIIPLSKKTLSPAKTTALPVHSSTGKQMAAPMLSISNIAGPIGKINRASGTNQGAVRLLGSIIPLPKNPTKTTHDTGNSSKPIMASLLRDSVTNNSNPESHPESNKVIIIQDELSGESGLHHGTSGSGFTGGNL